MKNIIFDILLTIFLVVTISILTTGSVLSSFEIVENNNSEIIFYRILANTNDDTHLEYIELYNTTENNISLVGYKLSDASGKTYNIGSITLPPKHIYTLPRTSSKIALNNTNETLFLTLDGEILQKIYYDKSQKNIPLTFVDFQLGIYSGEGIKYYSQEEIIPNITNEIIIELQRPSYGEFNTNGDFICNQTSSSCKINFDLRKSKAKSCHISISNTTTTPTIIDSCNPNTLTFEQTISTIKVTNLYENNEKLIKEFKVINKKEEINLNDYSISMDIQNPSNAEYDEDKNTFSCDKEVCRINLNFDESEAKKCKIIDNNGYLLSSKCNPGTFYFNGEINTFTIKAFYSDTHFLEETYSVINTYKKQELRDIIVRYKLQSPSSVYRNNDGLNFICDRNKSKCMINFDFSDTKQYNSDIGCHIELAGVSYTKCNPKSVYIPVGVNTGKLKIYFKNEPEKFINHPITVINKGEYTEDEKPVYVKKNLKASEFINFPKPPITIQSGLGMVNSEYVCKKFPCKVNLKYNKYHKGLICRWDFSFGSINNKSRTRCNPGYITFDRPGRFTIKLKVLQKINHTNFKTNSLTFRVIEEPITLDKDTKKILDKNQSVIFTKAEIYTQGKITKTKRLTQTGVICETQKSYCSINLGLIEKRSRLKKGQKLHYIWDFGNGITGAKKNPAAMKYPPGNYTVTLQIKDNENILKELNYTVEVKKINKLKKSSKKKEIVKRKPYDGKIILSSFLANPKGLDTKEYIELKNLTSSQTLIENCYLTTGKVKKYFKISQIINGGEILRLYKYQTKLSLRNTSPKLSLYCNDKHINTLDYDGKIPDNKIVGKNTELLVPSHLLNKELIKYGSKLKVTKLKTSMKITLDTYPGVQGYLYFQGQKYPVKNNNDGVIVLKYDYQVKPGEFIAYFETAIGGEYIRIVGNNEYYITLNDRYKFTKKYLAKKKKTKTKKAPKEKEIQVSTNQKANDIEKLSLSPINIIITIILLTIFSGVSMQVLWQSHNRSD